MWARFQDERRSGFPRTKIAINFGFFGVHRTVFQWSTGNLFGGAPAIFRVAHRESFHRAKAKLKQNSTGNRKIPLVIKPNSPQTKLDRAISLAICFCKRRPIFQHSMYARFEGAY
jgi:hypothetical protein